MALAKIRDRQHPVKHALLIIDVQQALCSGAEAAFDIDRVVDRINSVSTKARVAGAPVFLIQHEETTGISSVRHRRLATLRAPAVQLEDTAFARPLRSFNKTELHVAASQNVETLVVCATE
jgi:nicotinamidase-related amidase